MLLYAVLCGLFVGVKIDVKSIALDVLIAGVLCYVRHAIDQYQAAQRDYIGVNRYGTACCGNCARISDTIGWIARILAGAFINAWPGIILHILIIPPIVLAIEKVK